MREKTAILSISAVCLFVCLSSFATAASTHVISGVVADGAGTGLGGVDVVADNGGPSTITGADGTYSIVVQKHWSGTVTVSKAGWLMTPGSNYYDNVSADIPNQDYTAWQPTISGYVRKSDGTPLAGANVTADNGGRSDTTDASGYYEIVVPYEWSGAVSATLSGYHFTDKNYSNVVADEANQDFSGFQPTISGSTGVAGATVTVSGVGSVISTPSYSVTVPYGWSGTIEVSLAGYYFSESPRSFTNVTANQTGQDFTPYQPTISGYTGVAGATVTVSGVGSVVSTPGYSVTVPYGWSGAVEATLSGYDFIESPRSFTNVTTDLTGQDFTPYQPTISGTITEEDGTPVEGVAVAANNGGGSDTTDASGFFEVIVPYSWSGQVSANKIKCDITPENYAYSNLIADAPEQDFIASYISTIIVKADGTGYVPTIQAAIDIAEDGDTVQVEDGTYTGTGNRDIDFLGKAITVRGNVTDPSLVVIDCQGSWENFHQGFMFVSGEDVNSVVENFTIINGYVWANHGGGIRCHSSSPTIQNCIITENRSPSGGGVYCVLGSPIIKNCTIKNNVGYNSASGYGGGIYCNNSNTMVKNCHIINNSANEGGGIYCWNDNLTIKNSFIAGNNGEHYGGAFYCAWSNTIIENCTITSNNAGADGGGIHSYTGCNSIIRNSIIWNNSQQQLSGWGNNATYSNIQGGCGGTGNIDLDPLFQSNGYSLSADSPCINAGDPNTIADVNEVDIDGNLRIVGTRVDMGADEFSTEEPFILMSVSNLNFTAMEARNNPVPQTITFYNLGRSNLNWTASSNTSWLQTIPASGSVNWEQTATISITPDIGSLTAGQYFGQITISDPNAMNNPKMIDVYLTITGPSLSISQNNYNFTASKETLNPEPQVLTISNTGGGTLNWSITPNCNWMQIEPDLGVITTGSADVMLNIDQSNMEYGTYNCQLTVEAPNASNSPQVVTVSLDVLRPEIGFSPASLDFECDVDDPNVLTQVLEISNNGYDTLNWNIAEDCEWLSVLPVSGQCAAGPNEVMLTVDTTALEIGYYDCQLTITDENASNSPVTVPVSLHVYRDGERHVPIEYPTIQTAINAAVDGDHVIVHPGWYPSENYYYDEIRYQGKAVTVRSIEPDNPEIVGSTIVTGRFYFDKQEGRDAVLDGLTINGYIYCYNSSPVIKNCVWSGSLIPYGDSGYPIYVNQGNPCIQNCTFVGVQMTRQGGGGIRIYNNRNTTGNTIIENCLFSLKCVSYPYDQMSAIMIRNGHADIVNTTIAYCLFNIDEFYPYVPTGAGLFIRESDVLLENSIIWGNQGSDNKQVTIQNNSGDFNNPLNSRVTISYSDIEDSEGSILIFPDYSSFGNYLQNGILPDPNLVDPNTLTWGPGNIDTDPVFAREPNDGGDGWFPISIPGTSMMDYSPLYNNDYGDLHLKSKAGRFVWDGFARADFNLDKRVDLIDFTELAQNWGLIRDWYLQIPCNLYGDDIIDLDDFLLFCEDYLQPRVFGAWVVDDVTSPCIDAGDPNDMGWQDELWPHGGRINMGAYGGTPQASMSLNPVGNPADLNHDDAVDLGDWSLWSDDWLDERVLLDSDFDLNNIVDPNDLSIFLNNWLWGE